ARMLQQPLNVAEPLEVLERKRLAAVSNRPEFASPSQQSGNRNRRFRQRLPDNFKRGYRMGQALECQLADRVEPIALAPRQAADHVGDENLPARRRGAQPRGLHYRRTVEVNPFPGCFAGRYANTDPEWRFAIRAGQYFGRLL